jgi:hypothetical protein
LNVNALQHSITPELRGWLEQEGWKIDRPCPCCPASNTSTFRAASPRGRLMLHAADPHETGRRLYSLSPASGLGSWVLTVPEELTGTILAAALNALDHTPAPPVDRTPERIQPVEGLDLLDFALGQVRQEVITIYLRVDECVEGICSSQKEDGR